MTSPDVAKDVDRYLKDEMMKLHTRIKWFNEKNLAATLAHTFWIDKMAEFFYSRRISRLDQALCELESGNPNPVIQILQSKLMWENAASLAVTPYPSSPYAIHGFNQPLSPFSKQLSDWISDLRGEVWLEANSRLLD